MTKAFRNQAGGNSAAAAHRSTMKGSQNKAGESSAAAAHRSMAQGSQNQAGGNSAPLRRSGRAAVTSQVVSSAVYHLEAATRSFRRLAVMVGTPGDTPNLRVKICTAEARIEEMVNETSHTISKFMEPDHYNGATPAREAVDGELANAFAKVIGDYQQIKENLVEREKAAAASVTQTSEADLPQRMGIAPDAAAKGTDRPMMKSFQNQAGGKSAAADRSMAKGSQNQEGGDSAPLRRSGRAAVASQVASSSVSQLEAELCSFRRLTNMVGTPRDTPNLRVKICTAEARIEEMVKDTSYSISKFMEPDHYDGATPAREAVDGELANAFAKVIGDYQQIKENLVEREKEAAASVTQTSEADLPQRPRTVGLSIKPPLRARPPRSLASTSCGVEPPTNRSMRSSLATSSSTHHHPGVSELRSKGGDASITIQEFRALLKQRDNIRNVCLITNANKGKSEVADLLMADAGVESMPDYDDADTGITTESIPSCMYYESSSSTELSGVDGQFLINLFESNYHCDSEPIRMSDGVFVVIELTGNVFTRTENVLKQALSEGLIPVLVLDEFQEYFKVVQEGETAYEMLSAFISGINNKMSEFPGGFQFHPEKGTVAFSASSCRWAFTLTDFAEQHASELEVNKERMMELMWGDNFYDTDTKSWTTENTGSPTCKRGFVHFCYDPIMERTRKGGLKIMQKWLPASACLIRMMISCLPSPAKSQKGRLENLYEGPVQDRYAEAIKNCDPTGPLMVYLSSMIPASPKSRPFAFGRIFAGTVRTGMKVRIMGPNYANRENDVLETQVIEVSMLIGKKLLAFEDVPCGNNVAVSFEYTFVSTNATFTNKDAIDAQPIGALRDGYYRLMPQGTVDKFYEIPATVFRQLAHHQDGALRWFWHLHCKGKGGILGDDMGMGKTREVCAFLRGLFHSEFVTSVLIIIPRTVLKQWVEELRFTGLENRLKIFSDSAVKAQSKQLEDAVKNGGILLTTYGLFTNHKSSIMGKTDQSNWDYMILDEGHTIKNMETNASIALNDAKCNFKIVITGTPYQNNMMEFYSLMNFACPGLLGDENYFVQLFDIPIDKGKHQDATSEQKGQAMRAFKKLEVLIGPHMLRRTKQLLQRQGILKKKDELVVWLKLAHYQGLLYRKLRNVPRDSFLGAFAELQVAQNICNHPRILNVSRADGPVSKYSKDILNSVPTNDHLVDASCKVSFILFLVKRLLKENHKILIFSQSIPMLGILQEALQSIVDKESILYMDGRTKLKKRDRLVEAFTKKVDKCSGDENLLKNSDDDRAAGKEPLIFIMSTEIGGLGLNLVSASRVIIVDPSKNPSTDNQTVDRVFRFNQNKDVVVYRLMTCETVEEHVYRQQVLKGETAHSLTEGKQILRAVPRRNRRVVSLPQNDFSISEIQRTLSDEYANSFDEKMVEEVRLVKEHSLVMSVTKHSALFSLEEECHDFPLDDEDDDEDERLILQKVSRGRCRIRNTVVGGSKHAVLLRKSKSADAATPGRFNRRGNDYQKDGLQ